MLGKMVTITIIIIPTMILGTTIFFSAMIVFFNLMSDLAALWLNPRSRDLS